MPFESTDAESALSLFQRLAASEAKSASDRADLIAEFFRDRSIEIDRSMVCPNAAALIARPASLISTHDDAIDLLLTASLGASNQAGLSDLAAFTMLATALFKIPSSRIAFALLEEDPNGTRQGAQALAEAHPRLLKARTIVTPSSQRPFDWKGFQIHPLVHAFKGRVIVALMAKGECANAGHSKNTSAAYHLARGLLRLGNQCLPIHITPPSRQMTAALRRKASGPASLRFLEHVPRLADMALEGPLKDFPVADQLNAALRNTVAPIRLELDPLPEPGALPEGGTALLDGRLTPGQEASSLLFELRVLLDDAQLDLAIHTEVPSVVSPLDSPFVRVLENVLESQAADVRLVPWLSAQPTDAALFAKSGTPIYGIPIAGDPRDDGPARALWMRSLAALFEAFSKAIQCVTTDD